jgi:hypothetical protein
MICPLVFPSSLTLAKRFHAHSYRRCAGPATPCCPSVLMCAVVLRLRSTSFCDQQLDIHPALCQHFEMCAALSQELDMCSVLSQQHVIRCALSRQLGMCSALSQKLEVCPDLVRSFRSSRRFPAPWYLLTLCQEIQIIPALSRALICAHTLPGDSDIRGDFPRLHMCSHFARSVRYSRRFPSALICALRFPSALPCAHTLPEASDIRGAFPVP